MSKTIKKEDGYKLTPSTFDFQGEEINYFDITEYMLYLVFCYTKSDMIIVHNDTLHGVFNVPFRKENEELIADLCLHYDKSVLNVVNYDDDDVTISHNDMLNKIASTFDMTYNSYGQILNDKGDSMYNKYVSSILYSKDMKFSEKDINYNKILSRVLCENDLVEVMEFIEDYDFDEYILNNMDDNSMFTLSSTYLTWTHTKEKRTYNLSSLVMHNSRVRDIIKCRASESNYKGLLTTARTLFEINDVESITKFYNTTERLHMLNNKIYNMDGKEIINPTPDVFLWLVVDMVISRAVSTQYADSLGWFRRKIYQMKEKFDSYVKLRKLKRNIKSKGGE